MLEIIDAVGPRNVAACWLPTDVSYPLHQACKAVEERGVQTVHMDMPVLRRAYSNPSGVIRIVQRYASIRRARPELAGATHAYLTTSAMISMAPLMKRRGLTVLLHVHETWTETESRFLTPFLRWVDGVIAVSQDTGRRIPAPNTVVRNGFADPYGGAEPPVPPSGPLRFLMASRWSSWKGHKSFLEAWKKADLSDALLIVLGAPPPTGIGVDVSSLVKSLELSNVEVVGETASVASFLEEADVVIVPSIKPDPLPTIAIEAAMSGRAVVASNIGGLPEIVVDGQTGWLVDPLSESEWVKVLRSVTKEGAGKMGAAARQRFLAHFTKERFRRDLVRAIGG
jgi:glycosyltransferase involved in cell wall biosynthesis